MTSPYQTRHFSPFKYRAQAPFDLTFTPTMRVRRLRPISHIVSRFNLVEFCETSTNEGEGTEPDFAGTKGFVFHRPDFAYCNRIQSGGYFPTQKRSKTLSITASEARSPVSSNRLSIAESIQTFTASSVSPASSACFACSIVLLASSTQAR